MFDFFVTAIDVIDAIDPGGAARDQAGQHQGRRCAKVAGHHAGTLEFLHALDDGGRAFLADAGTHAIQFTDVEEPVGEDAFGDDAHAIGEAEQCHELGLKIGGESGVGLRGEFHRIQAAGG